MALDASCVGKLFLKEPDSVEFRTWYQQMKATGADFQSSTLLQFELGNIVRREFAADERQGDILAAALDGIHLQEVAPADPFRFTQALTYYDAAYVCVAAESAALATYDSDMVKVARQSDPGIAIWDAKRIKAATKPGFVAWLKKQNGAKQPLQGFAKDVQQDKFSKEAWSFLQFLGYLEEYRQIGGPTEEALDLALEEFVAAQS
ncbi:MAG TPA: type II toxin-antitoxin system VapC family toxin [Candidatus Thermoplasmatota archaeon]|nr:type II toxin-antitoxin system VapC family toxin [Candidatus Thermoplasmatota archaeon]